MPYNTTMETTFYHDDSAAIEAVKKRKLNLTLDFESSSKKKQKTHASILASPDMNMLKLASPELERMIIQQNGMITTTPTPSQFICPKFVTEEQEAYARGFVDALEKLHQTPQSLVPIQVSNASNQSEASTFTTLTTVTTTTALPGSTIPASSVQQTMPTQAIPVTTQGHNPTYTQLDNFSHQQQHITRNTDSPLANTRVMQLKEEPVQIVPCMGNTPPMSPINMGVQEDMKLERKRERNRVAARKCRTRKLERISRLEDRVNNLKGQNTDLQSNANTLRDQVCKLKQQIMEHVNSGCQMMLTQNMS